MEKLVIQILLYAMTFALGCVWGMNWASNIADKHDRERSSDGRE